MSELNPQAEALNEQIKSHSNTTYSLLSQRGLGIFYPKEGILKQSADAKGTQYNATIGMVKEDDGIPARLPSIGKYIDLAESDSVTYAPSSGKPELREYWKELLFEKNPALVGKEISTPISSAGLTHGLYMLGYMFMDPGDEIVIPDKFWGNYRLIFEKGFDATFDTFPMFKDERFNSEGFSYTLSTSTNKLVVLLNFPNNPTGYTPSYKEVEEIKSALLQEAEKGKNVLVILDDAYFGLIYDQNSNEDSFISSVVEMASGERTYEQSLFAELADLHENLLVAKVDGGSKEDYILGFRTGFVTFGTKGMNTHLSEALELKMSGTVRGTISSAPNISQSILLKALKSDTYAREKSEKYDLLNRRFKRINEVLEDPKYREYFTALPHNSGYFLCLELDEEIDGEQLREVLLTKYSTGVIAMGNLIRIAFSSVPEDQIEDLFENIFDACVQISSGVSAGMSSNYDEEINDMLEMHVGLIDNPRKMTMIKNSIDRGEAVATETGALATWNSPQSTGRSPKDTYLVERSPSRENVDWTSPNNIPLDPETFDMLAKDMIEIMKSKSKLIKVDRTIGADSKYAMPVRVIGDSFITMAFVDNMFKEIPLDLEDSVFNERPFTILVLPNDKVTDPKYIGRLREVAPNEVSEMVIAIDLENRLGIVYGSEYCGSVKKLMFTVMNYMLPEEGILPLHCSANEGEDGDVAVLLGLSGTGKTTLSTDESRRMIGDDEHGWSDDGIANFENGSYAKLINLDPEKEPGIYKAVFTPRSVVRNGVIIENAMIYPDGTIDLDDERITANSRASFPLRYLENIKEGSVGSHPEYILFLTADANGVIPPVSKLNNQQAMLWFLMGYTSKLAGTEAGVTEPKTVFSRFFGEPFMPRHPKDYIDLLSEKIGQFDTKVYLVNTGWTGGPYGEGERIDIMVTRAILQSIFDGSIEESDFIENEDFHISVPTSLPGVDSVILDPVNTWENKDAYWERVDRLTNEFSEHFDKAYGDNVPEDIRDVCPGK